MKYLLLLSLITGFSQRTLGEINESLTAEDRDINPFSTSYLYLEYSQNFPVAYAEVFFEAGARSPAFGYRFVLDSTWYMGVGAQFRFFKRKDAKKQETLPLFTFSQEAMRLFRIHHPIYLTLGYELLYIGPANKASLPIQRDDDYESEIGAAISSNLIVVLKNKSFFNLFIDRWRGTKTQRLQGINVGLGYNYPL